MNWASDPSVKVENENIFRARKRSGLIKKLVLCGFCKRKTFVQLDFIFTLFFPWKTRRMWLKPWYFWNQLKSIESLGLLCLKAIFWDIQIFNRFPRLRSQVSNSFSHFSLCLVIFLIILPKYWLGISLIYHFSLPFFYWKIFWSNYEIMRFV